MATSEVPWPEFKAGSIIATLKILDAADISVEDIAWVRGALVLEGGLRGADARLLHTPGIQPAIIRVNSSVRPAGRKRFAIAHELGHLELKHNPGSVTECAEKEFLAWYQTQNDQEVDANVFAAALLMPKKMFLKRLEGTVPSMELIEELAEFFQTTLTATAIRYTQLCGERCAVVFSKNARIDWVRRSPDFGAWIPPKAKLSENTYAVDYHTRGNVSTKRETARLDAWVEDASQWATIYEQSRPLPSYKSLLTLLSFR
jgi:Zn-dependent peptidase ImmA (M78 family)